MSPARFFIGLGWNWNHRTEARLSAEPGHQRAQEHLDVDDIRLRPPRPAIRGKLEGCITWTSTPRRTRQPKSVATRLMGQNHPRNRLTCRGAAGLQSFDQ